MKPLLITRHTTSRRPAIALAALFGLATAVSAAVGITDGPKGVVVMYVANRLSDKVTVIDGRTNRAVQR